MARTQFIEGIQCQKCGHMLAHITVCTSELCQECGAHIVDIDFKDRSYSSAKDGKAIVIKETKRLFRPTIYEFVRKI